MYTFRVTDLVSRSVIKKYNRCRELNEPANICLPDTASRQADFMLTEVIGRRKGTDGLYRKRKRKLGGNDMAKYIMQRILAMLVTLFIIITIGFMVIRLMPGGIFDDAVDMTYEQRTALEAKYNLDKPIPIQYAMFLKGLVLEGDWGTSLKMYVNVPVWDVIKTKIPVTLYINFFSLIISLPLGIILGIVAAIRKNTMTDYLISFLVVIFISVPSFIFATLLQYFVAFKAGLFPIIYDATASGWDKFYCLFLPIMALSLGPIARVTRYLRAELAETINSDFMLLAKTKGLTERQATINHGIRNSMLPLMNIIVPMFTSIMGGSLVIETIFSIPGMGGIMVKSINAPDYTVTLAALIFYSVVSLVTVLIVDLSYGIVDPRVRMGGKK